MPGKVSQTVKDNTRVTLVENMPDIILLPYPVSKARLKLPGLWLQVASFLILSLITLGYFGLALINPPQAVLVISFKKELSYSVPINPTSLQEVETTVSLELAPTAFSTSQVPSGFATGKVRFISLENAPLTFPENTLIWQKGSFQYRLTTPVQVPGFGSNPGVAEGWIVADKPGPEGNSPPFSSFMLSGAVRVQSLTPLSGGTTRTARILTSADLEKLRQELERGLNSKSTLASLQKAVLPGYSLLPTVTLLGREFNLPTPGEEYTGQVGKVRAVAKALSYNPTLLLREYALPENSELLGPPIFVSLDEGLVLHYSRPVLGSALLPLLKGWQGSKKQYDALVEYLKRMPEVENLLAPSLPADFRALSIKVVAYEKA